MKRMVKGTVLSLLLLLPVVLQLSAAPIPKVKPEEVGMSLERLQRIDQMLERRIAAGEMTGAVAIVARKGKIAHLTAKGVMDLETKQPVTPATMFRVASMTKPVTSVAIMMMIEEGKIRLNDPVSRYIPEFRAQRLRLQHLRPRAVRLRLLRRLRPQPPPAVDAEAAVEAVDAEVERQPSRQSLPSAKSRSRTCSPTLRVSPAEI